MFFKNRQAQIVDVNKLVEQAKEGVLERDRLNRIERLLTEKAKEIQASFREELEEMQRQMEEDYEKAVTWNEELARKGAIKDDEREMC